MRTFPRRTLTTLLVLATTTAPAAAAQEPPAPIQDNSFLVEEAYNQGPGIVQHVATFERARQGNAWALAFTQEWPVVTQRHQLAYTVPLTRSGGSSGIGDVAIHYRYQAGPLDEATMAFAPRVSLVLPTGSHERGFGAGGAGIEVNLPLSAEIGGVLVMHSNVGARHTPTSRNAAGADAAATDFRLAQSVIWLARPKLNFMLEAAWTGVAEVAGEGRITRSSETLIAPGIRGAFDCPSGLQVVPGLAFPIPVGSNGGEWGVFAYLSVEHPFSPKR